MNATLMAERAESGRGRPAAVPARAASLEGQASGAGLDQRSEAVLARRAQAGDPAARERLIEMNRGLIRSVAREYRCRSLTLDDLIQEGIVGLIAGIERFDPERGYRLSTYALHWVRQAIARAVGQNDRLIRVPSHTGGELRSLHRLCDRLRLLLGREPTEEEIARAGSLPEERVRQLLGAGFDPVSLEELVDSEAGVGLLEASKDSTAPHPERSLFDSEQGRYLRRALDLLPERERTVLAARFGLDGAAEKSLEELSAELRISRETVRQVETRAMRRLRTLLRDAGWE